MKNPINRFAFTLIELLIVIAIISILAALIIPVTGAVNRNKMRAKARTELTMVQMAIENYKTKMGHYPPDNPGRPSTNQLYFELLGCTNFGTGFATLDGSARIQQTEFPQVFGPGVSGFVNCVAPGGAFYSRRPQTGGSRELAYLSKREIPGLLDSCSRRGVQLVFL